MIRGERLASGVEGSAPQGWLRESSSLREGHHGLPALLPRVPRCGLWHQPGEPTLQSQAAQP